MTSTELAALAPRAHGTRSRYCQGCRCAPCREANTAYECWRQKCLAAGARAPNPLISAARVRTHILRLVRAGLGRRRLAMLARVPRSTICAIADGEREHIRQQGAERILAVRPTLDNLSGNALISTARTKRWIDELLAEGFSSAQLARELGYKNNSLQFNFPRITVRNARRIRDLHCKYMTVSGHG